VTLRTNLADSAITRGVKSGEITSPLVNFDFCGPKVAHSGFKAMVRGGEFDAGELAIVTFLQAKAFGKPLVLMPVPIVGRFQHHCIAYSTEHGQ
jgi:4,5-dihydroxyphthalate decarboxylase